MKAASAPTKVALADLEEVSHPDTPAQDSPRSVAWSGSAGAWPRAGSSS